VQTEALENPGAMNIAFAIVNLFPGGGLQRECFKLASLLSSRGHLVTIFAERCSGPIPADLKVEILPNRAWMNHRRQLVFADDVVRRCEGQFDRIVGFGKLKSLDVIFCADPCIALRPKSFATRVTGRQSTFVALEGASFAANQKTLCLLLSETQIADFRRAWSTEPERLKLIPPSIDGGRRQPGFRTNGVRERVRSELGVGVNEFLWLAIAGQPKVKGLDRTLAAMDEFPEARLIVAGLDPDTRRARSFLKLAKKANQLEKIKLLGFRDDIPELMAAADILIHPARYDTTGGVIVESIINGLPVVTTPECGYASHVTASNAGLVIPSPFSWKEFLDALRLASSPSQRAAWSRNGIAYGEIANLYSGVDRAADLIEGLI
jgi:UDP-glucose:(heptosyl)LPS alpha-1,3-glucosyltransferase